MADRKFYLFSEEHQVMPCYMEDVGFHEMSPMPSRILSNKIRRKIKPKYYYYSKNINVEEQEEDLQGV